MTLLGLFFGDLGQVQKLMWDLLMYTNNFCFQNIALFLFYHVVLSLFGGAGAGAGWVVVPIDYLVSLIPSTVLVVFVGVVIVVGL